MNIKSAKVHIVYAPTQEFLVDFLCLETNNLHQTLNNSVRKVGHTIGVSTGLDILCFELNRT